MSIVEKLRKLIRAKGGSPIGVMTIADGVNKLQKMEDEANPLSALEVDANIGADVDLLGKVVADLQSDVIVDVNKITGNLNYIDDYTDFSGDPEEQVGWYLVVHASVPNVENVTIKLKHTDKAGDKTLDPSDGILILRVTEKTAVNDVKLTFTAYKDGCAPFSKTFALADLTLLPPSDDD